jgi:hypothetical protein
LEFGIYAVPPPAYLTELKTLPLKLAYSVNILDHTGMIELITGVGGVGHM